MLSAAKVPYYCTNQKCGGHTSDPEAEWCFRCKAPLTDDPNGRGVHYSDTDLERFARYAAEDEADPLK